MKKFIKKTIAGLIAGLMAISSMPFTALAAEPTALEQAKTALNNFNYTAPTGDYGSFNEDNQENWAKGTGYTTYMRNVLYGEKGTAEDQGKVIDNKVSATIHYPQMVLLYDGVKENYLDIPVMSTAQGTTTRYIYSAVNENNEFVFTQPEHWYGEDVQFNWAWLYSNQITKKAGNFLWGDAGTMGTTDSQTSYYSYIKNGNGNGNWYKWANMYRFVGEFEDGTFTKSVCPKLTFYAGSSSAYNYNDIKFTCVATKPIYFINYKAVLNKIDEAKNTINSVNYNEYTKESVDAYAQAVMGLVNLDKNFGFDEGVTQTLTQKEVADKVQLAERDIRNAVNAYDHATLVKVNKLKEEEYNAALATAKAEAAKTNEYTEASFKALTDEIAAVEEAKKTVTEQKDLDALTARLLTAISKLVQAKFNVVFVTVGLDSTTENEKFNKYIEYGETCNADAGANVKKWVVTTDNGNTSTVIDNFDQKASFVITKDAKIYAYLSGEDSSPTSSKVTFLGRHNQVVAIRYVAKGDTLDTKTVKAPSIPFYKFENWDVASVKGNGNEYTVKATYTCNQESSDFCTVHFGDWSRAYAYDSYVYLPNTVAGTKYALYSDKQCIKFLTVLDGVDFYAPKTSDIYVKAYDAEEKAIIAVTGSFAEKDEKAGKKYANFNCKFYLPADAKAIEWGVEVLSTDGTRTAKVKAENLSKRNEYTVRFGTAIGSSVPSIKGRAYLVYEQNGEKKTIYSSDESDESDKYVTVNLNA